MDWVQQIILDHLWIEMAILAFAISVSFLTVSVQRVIQLKPLQSPASSSEQPAPKSKAERELQMLDFRWLGDFDASASRDVVMKVRAYVSADRLHGALFAVAESGDERNSMLEFSTNFKPHGNLCTNNSTQASVYVYPVDKFIAKAPWKQSVGELRDLHLDLCRVVSECGFQPATLTAQGFSEAVAVDSRRDLEIQTAHGRMKKVGDDRYRMTVKGAILMTPRVWWRMAYGFLFGWYRPGDGSLIARVRKQFTMASQQLGVYEHR